MATRTFRIRAAAVLAGLYALCILVPSAAFAFSDDPGVARCLIEDHVGVHVKVGKHDHGGKLEVHVEGIAHQQHDGGAAAPAAGDDALVATCCSLFSIVAIPDQPELSLGLYSPASVVVPPLSENLSGRGPDRINRPPIA